MLSIVLYWLYLFLFFVFTGHNFLHIFFRFIIRNNNESSILLKLFTGITTLLFFTGLFHLFFPVNGITHLVLLLMNILISLIFRKQSIHLLKQLLKTICDLPVITTIVLLIIIFSWALLSTDLPFYNWDEGRYHLQALLWTKEYKIIPGLANLHERFGTNSAWYPMNALFDVFWFEKKAFHILNSFILLIPVVNGSTFLFRKNAGIIDVTSFLITIIILANTAFIHQWYWIGVTPDTPLQIMIFMMAVPAVSILWGEKRNEEMLPLLTMMTASAIMLRIGGIVIIPFAALLFIFVSKQIGYKPLFGFFFIVSAAFLLTIVRNYYLSGYLFYPVFQMPFLKPEWVFPWGKQVNEWVTNHQLIDLFGNKKYTGSFCFERIKDLSTYLFKEHIQKFGSMTVVLILFFIQLLWCFFTPKKLRNTLPVVLLLLLLFGIVFIQSGGVFRFISGFVWLIECILLVLLIKNFSYEKIRKWAYRTAPLLFILFFVNGFVLSEKLSITAKIHFQNNLFKGLFHLHTVPETNYESVSFQNIIIHFSRFENYTKYRNDIWYPTYDSLCVYSHVVPFCAYSTCAEQNAFVAVMNWMNPLPSVGAIYPGLTMRGHSITDGFLIHNPALNTNECGQ